MIINGLIVNKSDGKVELMDFINEKTLASLFESFVRKYYQVEYKGKLTASGELIKWQINEEYENNKMIELLPQMHTDITLRHKNKELIIDTKFYDKTISKNGFNGSDKETIKSNNWYQINSYVTNKVYEYNKQNKSIEVAGMLLYAKTDEEMSLVCKTNDVPKNTTERDDGWKGFRIQGVLDFSLIGILSKLSGILAENNIGIFAVSTFNTDYILIKTENYEKALSVLSAEGYTIV